MALLAKGRFDGAHVDCFSGRAFLWAEAVTRLLHLQNVPYVLTTHGGGLREMAARHPRRVRRVLVGASAVTAPSRFLAKELAHLRGDIVVVPNGIEIAAYPYRERTRPKPRLVWLRAMHRVYDPRMAVEATALVAHKTPGVSLTMIGPDKKDGSLESVRSSIRDLGLEGTVHVIGPVGKSEVPAFLDVHDVLVNTSRVDNAPVSLVEAMACGLCIVTTGAGGIPDIVRNGHDGLVVPVGDALAMCEAINRVISDPGLSGSLSRNARETSMKYDWQVVVPQWRRLFERAFSSAQC